MALPNTDPIYTRAGDVQSVGWLVRVAASTLYDGAGTIATSVADGGPHKVWQANATNGGFFRSLIFKYGGTSTTVSNATTMKVFISSVSSGSTTDADTWLIDEIALPATTPSATGANITYSLPINLPIPAGYTILVKCLSVQPASMGWYVTGIGGKY